MKKIIALLVVLLSTSSLYNLQAQKLIVNKGDKYQITSALSSSTAIKRNNMQIDVTAISTITKQYEVIDVTNEGYRLKITNTKITDTINSLGNKIAYTSDKPANPNSEIEMQISKLANSTYYINLDKTGKIIKVDDTAKANEHAIISNENYLYHKDIVVGNHLNFGTAIVKPTNATIGTEWTLEEGTAKSIYTLNEINANTTKISYKTTYSDTGTTLGINGIIVVDNATGVVLKRVNKSSERSLYNTEGKTFSYGKDYTLAEVCNKVN